VVEVDVASRDYAEVDAAMGANLRAWREAKGISQEDLAAAMTTRGFGFSQSTIWKIEQGRRPLKVTEAVALSDALELRSWNDLTASPDTVRHEAQLQSAHQRAARSYQALKDATTAYLRAQLEVAVAVVEARDAGAPVAPLWTAWLSEPAERAAIEAHIEFQREDEVRMDLADATEAVMAALRERGIDPVINVDDVVRTGPA
jgi:transcriptional regulator with XRE-family HTH domain